MKKGCVRLKPTDIVDAANEGNIHNIRAILERYPGQVDIQHNGQTAMQIAAHKGHVDIIKLLASPEYCADVDLCDSDFKTPLHYAVNGNQPAAVELLLNLGAKMEEENDKGETPPQIAFNNQDKDCVRIFLERNRNVCLKKQSDVFISCMPTTGRSQGPNTEPPDEAKKSTCGESNSKKDLCFNCEEYEACITFEPCNCKISCFVCSIKNPACNKCGMKIEKRSYTDDAPVEAFIDEIGNTKQRVKSLVDKDTCIICMVNRIDCTLGCGHMFCIPCVKKNRAKDGYNWACPHRCKPTRFTKVYLPKESEAIGP